MATIKKAQSGAKVKKPTYKNLRMGVANQSKAEGRDYTEVATKKDSSEYKKGFARGVKKDKESRNDISEVEKVGRWEGLNTKKNGGPVKKAKNGKSFPDLNKDGKITKADILKGRGVIAKKGASVKKMQYGGAAASMVPMKKGGVVKKDGMHKMPNGSMMKNSAMKSGGKMSKCKYGCN